MRLMMNLATIKVLLSHSQREGWGLEYPKETEEQIDQITNCLFFEETKPLPKYWQVLYAPTGPLQEITMANGWSDVYMRLSEEFDSLEYILKEHEKKSEPASAGDAETRAPEP